MRLLFLIFTLWIFTCNAEKVKGPANIYSEPKSNPFLRINDSVEIECSPIKGEWVSVIIYAKITKAAYESETALKKGDNLYDLEDKYIGTVIDNIPSDVSATFNYGGAPGVPQVFGVEIHAKIKKENIHPNSVIENVLPNFINNKSIITKTELTPLMKEFGFVENDYLTIAYPQLIDFGIFDSYFPDGRVRLIFEGNDLIAIVFNNEMKLDNVKVHRIDNSKWNKIAILKLPKNVSEKDFLLKHKESYYGRN